MMKYNALIVDYGGVLSLPQNPENVAKILQRLGAHPEGFEEAYFAHRGPYDCGQVTGEVYWGNVIRQLGLEADGIDIRGVIEEDIRSWTHLNRPMIEFLQKTRVKIPRLAMISNMPYDTLTFLQKHYGWLGLFDGFCFSCEMGIKKPGREIYEACIAQLGLPAGECLFVDDSERNVDGALACGMAAIRYEGMEGFLRAVAEGFGGRR